MLIVVVLSVVRVIGVACILRLVSISPNDPALQNSLDITVMRIGNNMTSAAETWLGSRVHKESVWRPERPLHKSVT